MYAKLSLDQPNENVGKMQLWHMLNRSRAVFTDLEGSVLDDLAYFDMPDDQAFNVILDGIAYRVETARGYLNRVTCLMRTDCLALNS